MIQLVLFVFFFIGFKTLNLLEKKSDVYLHFTQIKKWDICAPNAILANRGGDFRTRSGSKINYDNDSVVVREGFIAALDNFDFFIDTFKNR